MLSPAGTRLEVWGDPIAHSRSPQLHAAAYRVLGLDWTYGRRRVAEADFAGELAGLTDEWRGLSLTMPLKGVACRRGVVAGSARRAHRRREHAAAGRRRSARVQHRRRRDRPRPPGARASTASADARIVGAGRDRDLSALVALGELGADRVEVVARRAAAVQPLERARRGDRQSTSSACSFDDVRHIRVYPSRSRRCRATRRCRIAAADALAAQRGPPAGRRLRPLADRARERVGARRAVRRRRDWGCCCTRPCCRCGSSSTGDPDDAARRRSRRARRNAPGGRGRLDECSACSRPANPTAPNSSPSWRACPPASPCRAPRSRPISPVASSATAAVRG